MEASDGIALAAVVSSAGFAPSSAVPEAPRLPKNAGIAQSSCD
jgi:hypothetical protein